MVQEVRDLSNASFKQIHKDKISLGFPINRTISANKGIFCA